ncbi:MAG: TrmH family RNA methyltransferase [Kiritimatiellia bacterium]
MYEPFEITSPSNPRIKAVVKLRTRSHRDEAGEMIVEGYREISRALADGYRPHRLFFCPELYLKDENEPALVEACGKAGAELCRCSRLAFEKMAYKDRPDGLLAIGPQVAIPLSRLSLPPNALVIVAEAIEKPGNLGTILRTADAAGVAAVLVCDKCTDIHNPNVVRASTGALFSVPVVDTTGPEALQWLRAKGFHLLAATPHAEALHFDVPLTGNTAIAVGAEQYGLTRLWMDAADLRVRIPMLGQADSLNVSAAATILLYEAVRQRIAAGIAQVPAYEPWHGEACHDH